MKTAIPLLGGLISLFLLACHPNGTDTENPKNKKMTQTKQSGPDSIFTVALDESVDREALEAHYTRFPERWRLAANYLAGVDTTDLPTGRTDLSEEVYVTVSRYTTKNPEDALYESHREYIDLQYIVSGSEYIGITRSSELPIAVPYDSQKDIAFYRTGPGEERLAEAGRLFVFFPRDKHRPCIKSLRHTTVKKIVIKIKTND